MEFRFEALDIPDVLLVSHEIFRDARGFFCESYRENVFIKAGLPHFLQDNRALSQRNVVRGLHYQVNPAAMGKLVSCVRGRIFDVAVDIRKGSPWFGKWIALELSENDTKMLYIPEGFAHGYCAMSQASEVFYKTTAYYSAEHERSIRWNDPSIGIRWPAEKPLVSDKDMNSPLLADAEINFAYHKSS